MKATFKKNERLCSKKQIAELFSHGKSEFGYPFKTLFQESALEMGQPPIQVLISVPKRHFRKAHQRNQIKRLIREAYRQNKSELCLACQKKEVHLSIAFIFVAKEALDYSFIERKMKGLLKRLI